MADFPSLEPTTRVLMMGDTPQESYAGTSGGEVRFRYGSDFVAQSLTLGYEYLTEAETQQILDHLRRSKAA